MDKATVLALLGLALTYFSISRDRLIDLKIFATWICWAAFITAEAHDVYLIVESAEPVTLMRILAANASAIGVLVLLAAGLVFRPHLHDAYAPKKAK